MDIVEQLAQQAAETINGGEFYDGKWYTEGQRQAWRKAMTPAADEIERLRGIINDDRLEGAADEIERLRDDKAELVEALIDMRNHINKRDWDENVSNEAKATFAKATGEE
jgi:hypothetical protein